MNSKLPSVLVIAGTLCLAQGCSWFRDRPAEYLLSDEGAPLQVPEGLDQPRPVSPIVISVGQLRSPSGDELNPMPPRAAITAGGGEANAHIAWSATGVYMEVKDEPDSVARRLRFAIQRSGMNLVERNDDGSHRFEYRHERTPVEKGFFEKMLFWKDDAGPDYSGAYRFKLQPDGNETRVYLMHENGEPVDTSAAEHVLGVFMERLG